MNRASDPKVVNLAIGGDRMVKVTPLQVKIQVKEETAKPTARRDYRYEAPKVPTPPN
jgi:hypothetical protein